MLTPLESSWWDPSDSMMCQRRQLQIITLQNKSSSTRCWSFSKLIGFKSMAMVKQPLPMFMILNNPRPTVLFPRLLIFHLKRLASCFPAPFLAPISTIKWRNRRLCLSKRQHHRDDVAFSIHLAVKSVSVHRRPNILPGWHKNSAFS